MKPWEKYQEAEQDKKPWERYSAPAATDSVPAPNQGATGTWAEPQDRLRSDVTFAGSQTAGRAASGFFPRAAQAAAEGESYGNQALGAGLDLLSLPGRGLAALGRDEGEGYLSSMADEDGESFAGRVLRDPATGAAVLTAPLAGAVGAGAAGLRAAGLGSKLIGAGTTGAAEGAISAATHQAERVRRGQGVSAGQAAAEVGLSAALPTFIRAGAAGLRSLGKGSKNAISRLSDIPEDALAEGANPARLPDFMDIAKRTGGDQTKLADDVLGEFGKIRQADDEAIQFVNAKRQGALQDQILGVRRSGGALDDVSAFDAGKRIETTSQEAMRKAGEKFQTGQDQVLRETGAEGRRLLWGFKKGKNQNALASAVDDYLDEINYNPELGYGTVGNRVVPPGAINEIKTLKNLYEKARTTRDVLDMLRLTDQRIDFGGPENGRLFAAGSDEDWAIKSFRGKFGEVIENQIRRSVPADKADEFADLWHAHRAAYSNTRKAIETIQEGLGAGRVNTESYFAKIKEIGIEDLARIRTMAINDPDMRPVFEELQNGFFDNLIKKGIKDGGLDYDAFSKAWGSVDDDLKAVMLPAKVRGRVGEVLQRAKPIEFEPTQLGREIGGAGMSQQSAVRAIENIGTKDKRSALQELELLDDLLGFQGNQRFSKQAMDAFRAKQLQITPEGRLPMMNNARTGKATAGLSYGEIAGAGVGTAVGAMGGGILGAGAGAVLGKYAGQLAGAYTQSPAGALAAYRLLLQLEKPAAAGVRAVEAYAPKTTSALRSGLFRPESER